MIIANNKTYIVYLLMAIWIAAIPEMCWMPNYMILYNLKGINGEISKASNYLPLFMTQ